MDLVITERFIATQVYHSIDLENQNPWIPQIIHNVNKIHNLIGYVTMKEAFYIGCFSIVLSTCGSSLSMFYYLKNNNFWIFIPIITLSVIIILSITLVYITKKTDPYKRLSLLKGKKHV